MNKMNAWTWTLAVVSALPSGCVFPSSNPTGMELSWRFVEANDVDGEDGRLVRTCLGARVEQLSLWLQDLDAPGRADTFGFDCEAGYQTAEAFATTSSHAFVDLHAGTYNYSLGVDDAFVASQGTLSVLRNGVTLQPFDIVHEPIDWTLALYDLSACTTLRAWLTYRDPEEQLPTIPNDDDATAVAPNNAVLYRFALASDEGLSLAGEPSMCAELMPAHLTRRVDAGAYTLWLQQDDAPACPLEVDVSDEQSERTVRLSALRCDA